MVGLYLKIMQLGCTALKAHSRIMWPSTQNVCPPLVQQFD